MFCSACTRALRFAVTAAVPLEDLVDIFKNSFPCCSARTNCRSQAMTEGRARGTVIFGPPDRFDDRMEITIGVFMPEDPQPEPEPLNVELDQSPGPNNETQEEY